MAVTEIEKQPMEIICLDRTIEYPLYLDDVILGKKVSLNPVGTVSRRLGEKLIKTAPNRYAEYDKSNPEHKYDPKKFKVRKDYLQPEFSNIFNVMNPRQREIVLEIMSIVDKKSLDDAEKILALIKK